MVSPVIDKIASERPDVKVCKVNVDEQPELARKFGVMSIPTIVNLKNRNVSNQIVDTIPKQNILAML